MELLDLQRNWDGLGEIDPLWAVLSDPDKRERGWDLSEFLSTGRDQIVSALAYAEQLGYPAARHAALDFGCGVGRLTQPLCESFERCVGIDIAPSMIRQARELNQFPDRCEYIVNATEHLQILDGREFDFVYSSIVLQHIHPSFALRYLAEFVRLLAPGGLALFDLPAEPVNPAPLPHEAFSASIQPHQQVLHLPAGRQAAVAVSVMNTSAIEWSAPLNLGNHWLDSAGGLIAHDDARGAMTMPIRPGQIVEASISVTVPRLPGNYLLALDLVQESVAWFGVRGSPVACVPVVVEDAQEATSPAHVAAPDGPLVPAMEMHGIPLSVVAQTAANAGGRVVAIDPAGNGSWIGYRYAITHA